MNFLRSAPFMPLASTLQSFIFCCCAVRGLPDLDIPGAAAGALASGAGAFASGAGAAAAGAAAWLPERQDFMNALRSAPILPLAWALQSFIRLC